LAAVFLSLLGGAGQATAGADHARRLGDGSFHIACDDVYVDPPLPKEAHVDAAYGVRAEKDVALQLSRAGVGSLRSRWAARSPTVRRDESQRHCGLLFWVPTQQSGRRPAGRLHGVSDVLSEGLKNPRSFLECPPLGKHAPADDGLCGRDIPLPQNVGLVLFCDSSGVKQTFDAFGVIQAQLYPVKVMLTSLAAEIDGPLTVESGERLGRP
jgi:hypothetical protein